MKPDLPPEMKGADVPPQIVEAARRGYSMHGAGLVANLIAAAWPEIERQVRAEVADEIEANVERDAPIGDYDPFGEAVQGCLRIVRGERP